MDVEENEDLMEFHDQVRQTLEDVLPRKKMDDVSDEMIQRALENHHMEENMEMDYDYNYKYFPLKIVDLAIKEIVSRMAVSSSVHTVDSSSDPEEELEDLPEVATTKDILIPLSRIYPDIDLSYLKTIIEKFSGHTENIQEYLEANIETIPERRTIQAVQYRVMSSTCEDQRKERPWQCPQCRSWTIITIPKTISVEKKEPPFDLVCNEMISCGSFCFYCNRKSHAPFKCRTTTTRLLQAENEMDIFKKLEMPPDEVRAAVKIFTMKPKNDINFANPLDILYTTAEGTFLRMLRRGGGQGLDRSFIKEIKYYENDFLAERFHECKRRLEGQGITCKERLVFHGTPVDRYVESIFQDGLLLSKCKRFAHGYGIYFSEFPDISQVYGQHLLLCRVLVGRPYIEAGNSNIPESYNSKFVAPDVDGKAQMIIIDKEDQILPAFQIVTNQGGPRRQ